MSLYSTSTKGQCTPYTNDIVRFVKHNIQEPEAQPYVCKKIWMRSDNHRVEERKNHLWKKHFYRRQDNLSRGFYSVPWESFQPMGGDIVLDSGELVMKTLSHVLKSKELQKHTHLQYERQDTMPPVENPTIKKSSSSESVEATTFSRAGFQDIMSAISVTRDRILAVRAGLPYEEHVRFIKNLSKGHDDQQENGMVLMSLTDLHMMVMQSRKVKEEDDHDADHTDSSNIRILSPTPQPLASSTPTDKEGEVTTDQLTVDDEQLMAASPTSCPSGSDADVMDNNLVLRVNSGLTERKERIRKDHLEYLNGIHNVIVYLRRMQTRDLRSKTPLTRENLRDLLKVTSGTEKDSRLTQVRFSRNYNRRMSMDTSLSGDTSSLSQEGGRLSIFGVTGTSRRRSRVGSVFGNLPGMSGRRKSRMWERDYMKVETWEDLMALDDKSPSEGSPAAMTQNIIFKTLKWSRRTSGFPGDSIEEKENRKTPIWQQIAMEKSGNIFTEKKKHNKSEDPSMVVQRVRHNMAKLKHSLQKETESELQRLERVKMVMYQFKIQCFDDMLPSSLLQTHCERMQDTVHLINTNPDVEVQPSKWYEELQERTHSKIASDNPEINDVLSKIGRFAQMGPKTITYVKAKLCLLVMSLPAYQICKISMQAAIKFVLEKILVAEEDQFHHWLALRKMPNVLIK